MSDIAELMRRLREYADFMPKAAETTIMVREAADALEDLQYQLRDYADANRNANTELEILRKRIAELELVATVREPLRLVALDRGFARALSMAAAIAEENRFGPAYGLAEKIKALKPPQE